jgi:hypothetical protein
LLTQTAEVVVVAVSAPGLAVVVEQRPEAEGEELVVVKMRTVMGSGARKTAGAEARRMEQSRKVS